MKSIVFLQLGDLLGSLCSFSLNQTVRLDEPGYAEDGEDDCVVYEGLDVV